MGDLKQASQANEQKTLLDDGIQCGVEIRVAVDRKRTGWVDFRGAGGGAGVGGCTLEWSFGIGLHLHSPKDKPAEPHYCSALQYFLFFLFHPLPSSRFGLRPPPLHIPKVINLDL